MRLRRDKIHVATDTEDTTVDSDLTGRPVNKQKSVILSVWSVKSEWPVDSENHDFGTILCPLSKLCRKPSKYDAFRPNESFACPDKSEFPSFGAARGLAS